MDRAQADRLQAFFFKAIASWETYSEAKRLEAYHPRGLLTGPGGEPDALLVQADSGKHFKVRLTEEGEGFTFTDRKDFEPIDITVVRKSEAVAARLRQAKSVAEKEAVTITPDPKPDHSVAVSVEEIQEGYTRRRKAEAAAYDKHLDAEIEKRQREREAAVNAPDPFRTSPQERTPDSEQTIQKIHERKMRGERGE